MPKKRFGAEQIVVRVLQIEGSMAQGKSTPVTCRNIAPERLDERLDDELFYNLKEV